MPFPGTRVIHPDWSKHHAPVAAGGMNATVQIFNPDAAVSTWNPVTEQQDYDRGEPIYDNPARVQQLSTAGETNQAAQDVTAHTYLVQLLFDAPHIEQGWRVIVTEATNDSHLVAWTTTRPMHITDVQHGSERFTRDIVAEINLD